MSYGLGSDSITLGSQQKPCGVLCGASRIMVVSYNADVIIPESGGALWVTDAYQLSQELARN